MLNTVALTALLAYQATAWPFVAQSVGMDPELMKARDAAANRRVKRTPGDEASCPVNPNHVPAQGITAEYPYCGAANGLPGNQTCINNLVPAKGDTAHKYMKPGPLDIRGPCPGINTAANHNFVARDGITTFNELVDMQQNVYGVGYDLSVLLAVLGVGLDGDPVTTKLSIGCDATPRTAAVDAGQHELGLDGHNKFEGDTSLTRNDYFLGPPPGNNFIYNSTKFKNMLGYCNGNCNREAMANYRYERYNESKAWNGNFYFGPKSLLLFGAASFLYELFPTAGGIADPTTMKYFFQKEEIPPKWYSRETPYTIALVANEIFQQYQMHPVAFGGNTGKPNSFVGLGEYGPSISNSMLSTSTPAGVACLLYQVATENAPASLGGGATPEPTANLEFAASKLNPIFSGNGSAAAFGCPLAFNNA